MQNPRVILIGALAAGAGVLLFAFNPAEWAFFPRCPFLLLTGWHCPGCGTQRALHLLLHGDVVGALRHNALMMLCLPLLLYVAARRLVEWRWQRTLPAPHAHPASLFSLAVLVVAFFILRNTSAFAFLAPPG